MKFAIRLLVRVALILMLAATLVASGLDPRLQLASADEAAPAAAPAAEADPFKVPEGDAKTIQAFMEKLAQTAPEGKTEEEQMAFSVKALKALVEASEKLLAAKPDDRQTVISYGYKLEALQALVTMGQADAREQLEKAMTAARADSHEQVAGLGWQAYIVDRTAQWRQLDDAAKQAFHDDIIKQVDADGPKPMDASILQVTAMRLDGEDDAFLAKLLGDAVERFKKSEDKEVLAAVEEANLEGMLRRFKLPGNEMEISGELLGGGKVDWKSYRGKVVLVDFWATWCGPCRAEVPNVLEMYQAYHDKGFEVLGVSLDKTPEDAKKYVAEMKLPWDSLFPKEEEHRFWNHPLAKFYGIGGIPTAILVGKDGKVVHMNARGDDLRTELAKLLGEPSTKIEATKDTAAEKPVKAS